MFLPLLPLVGQDSLHHREPELRDRPSMSDSTFAEDMQMLHGDILSVQQSKTGGPSPSCTNTTSCHQPCTSKYYYSITPKIKIQPTEKKLKDGCLFSFFKTSVPNISCTPETTITTSSTSEGSSEATSPVTMTSDEHTDPQEETDAALSHEIADGEADAKAAVLDYSIISDLPGLVQTQEIPSDGLEELEAVSKGAEAFESEVSEHASPAEIMIDNDADRKEENFREPLAAQKPAARPLESYPHLKGPLGAQLGTEIPMAEPCSEQDLRVPDNLGQKSFVPDVEGNRFNHFPTFITQQQPASLSSGNISRDATPIFKIKSKDTETESHVAKVIKEPAQGPSTRASLPATTTTAKMPLFQNLERPDMSWASDSPVAFTSSASKSSIYVDKKIDELRARAEAAHLRRQILRRYVAQREQQVQGEEAASSPTPSAPPAQEKENTEVAPKKGKILNRKKQRQAAKAKRQMESSVATVVTSNDTAPSSPLILTTPTRIPPVDNEVHQSLDDEFNVEAKPTKRAQRAKAHAESKAKKAQEQKATEELKKLQEKEAAAQLATTPVLTAAAKRRNRQKRSNERKTFADALKIGGE